MTEIVDDSAIDQLNTWFSYVRQLSKPEVFEPLKARYVDYMKIVAGNDVGNEVIRINKLKTNLGVRIDKYIGQIRQAEDRQKTLSEKFGAILSQDDKSIENARKDLAKRKREILLRILQSIIGLALLGVGVLFIFDIIYSYGFFLILLGLFLIFLCLFFGWGLAFPGLRGIFTYRKNVASAESALKQAMEKKENEIKQYEMEQERLNSSIAEINNQIKKVEDKIADCDKYLALDRDKMEELLYAIRCNSIGVEQPYDPSAYQLRDAANEKIFP